MDKKDFLKNIYDDFFGIEKLNRENERLSKEIEELIKDNENLDNSLLSINNAEIPSIDVKEESKDTMQSEVKEISEEDKNKIMADSFEKIEKLYIDDKSKELLKKIIEYMRKYNSGIEKKHLSFNMSIYTNNDETTNAILSILEDMVSCFSYLKKGEAQIYSAYDIEKIEQIEGMYNSKCNIVAIKKLESFNSKEQEFKRSFSNKLLEKIRRNEEDTITVIIAKNKEESKDFLEACGEDSSEFTDFEIVGINPDVQEAYQDILEKLKGHIEVEDEMQVKLLDYVSNTFPNNDLPYPKYRDNLCDKVLFDKQVPEYEKEKSMEEIFADLNELVGLEKVKQVIRDLVSLIELKDKTKDDLKIKNVNLHMIFLGNPGTGKTTVARIIAQILYNLKYVKQNKLIEVSSKDLVAEYVGQTAPKTMAVIQKALGGVLFVDEAYSLASGNGQGNSYNEEAIATLIQAMENYRDELVVIFAGYTKEMQAFLNANSGIVSRIGYTLEFEDYTTDELIKIFTQMNNKAGFEVSEDAIEKVRELIEEYRDSENFGNARFVRNLYEKAVVKHATNTKGKKNKKILRTITKEDINAENLLK